MRLINWVLNRELLFWVFAFIFSLFWGVHAVVMEDVKKIWQKLSALISAFAVSFIGWISLIIFFSRINNQYSVVRFVDFLFLIVACMGISGWSYRLPQIWIKK